MLDSKEFYPAILLLEKYVGKKNLSQWELVMESCRKFKLGLHNFKGDRAEYYSWIGEIEEGVSTFVYKLAFWSIVSAVEWYNKQVD
jgi:hypothetical protein